MKTEQFWNWYSMITHSNINQAKTKFNSLLPVEQNGVIQNYFNK